MHNSNIDVWAHFLEGNTISTTIHGHKAKFTLVIILTITVLSCYLEMIFSRMNSMKFKQKEVARIQKKVHWTLGVRLSLLVGKGLPVWLGHHCPSPHYTLPSCRWRSGRLSHTPRTPRSSTSGTCTCISPFSSPASWCSPGCSTVGHNHRSPWKSVKSIGQKLLAYYQ